MASRSGQTPKTRDWTRAVGAALAHDSARRHVTGAARYVDDIAEPAGTLHVAPGFDVGVARGRIRRLDLDRARGAPGVVRVLTAADIPGVNDCSPSTGDDLLLAKDEVYFSGQVLFAVVAETRDQARRAARLAEIEIEPKPARVSPADYAGEPARLLPDYAFERGDASAAIDASGRTLAGSFKIGGQEHFYLEGQVSLAVPTEAGEMRIYASTQHPGEIQHIVAKILGVDDASIVCECRRMGGGFGGKETQAAQWAGLAALAAHLTGRPAKCRLDRDDDMILTGKRHDVAVGWRVGIDETGVFKGADIQFDSRCGCSADLSLGVNDRMMFHADNAYYYPAARIRSRRIRTDTVSNTAFRGFGGPQGVLAAERLIDAVAVATGIDALDVRKRNLYRENADTTPYGQRVEEHIALALIETLERACGYRERRREIAAFNMRTRFQRKGVALTPVKFGISFTLKHLNQAGALVHVYADGSVQLNHGGTEMGQGLYVKAAQIVADEFGIDPGAVRITATATDKVPNAPPTAASAGTDLNGMAAREAARAIRGRMAEIAARLLQTRPAAIRFEGGRVLAEGGEIAFAELARRCVLDRVSLSSTGFYATPKLDWDRERVRGRPFLYYAWGAACSEVTIDTMTGELRLDRVDILHDVGRSINPAVDIGQIEGGFVQGLGWLTTEELVFSREGKLLTHGASTYKIPTSHDVPAAFNVALWESSGNPEDTIYRSKAVGEPPLMLAASVFSAILDAVASLRPGRMPALDAPATPEAILRAVQSMDA